MKFLALLVLSIASFQAVANESGYLYQGKKHVVWADGEKKGEYPQEVRKPANFVANKGAFSDTIRYEVDSANGIVCYWKNASSSDTPLTCVKK